MTCRLFFRQDTQVENSDVYDDTLDMSNAETLPESIEDDLNYIRSQLKVITGGTNWYDPPPDGFGLSEIHDKPFAYWYPNFNDVTIPASQNYVVLSGTGKPSDNMAIVDTSLGAIVAQLSGSVGTHSTTAATNNLNLVLVRDADTNKPIFDADNHTIHGLLQVGNLATDGNAFADAGNDRGQISFVYIDPITESLTAVATSAIQGKVVEYAYRRRVNFYSLPEDAYDQSIDFFWRMICDSASVTTITSDRTLDLNYSTVLADASLNNITIYLPSAALYANKQYKVKKIDTSSHIVTIDPLGVETIDGKTKFLLKERYKSITFASDGANWWILSDFNYSSSSSSCSCCSCSSSSYSCSSSSCSSSSCSCSSCSCSSCSSSSCSCSSSCSSSSCSCSSCSCSSCSSSSSSCSFSSSSCSSSSCSCSSSCSSCSCSSCSCSSCSCSSCSCSSSSCSCSSSCCSWVSSSCCCSSSCSSWVSSSSSCSSCSSSSCSCSCSCSSSCSSSCSCSSSSSSSETFCVILMNTSDKILLNDGTSFIRMNECISYSSSSCSCSCSSCSSSQ